MNVKINSKTDYTSTMLGSIPNDWKYLKFEDALEGFSSGSTPSRSIPEYFQGDILWITSGELNYNVITDTEEKITAEAVKATNLKILQPGTFLFAITGLEAEGTRGSCAIVGKEATTNQSCMALRPKSNLLLKYFFHFYCHFGEQLAFKYCQGTKQQSYNGSTARALPLILPPLKEQKKISEILDTWDQAIQKCERTIEEIKSRNKGLAQQLLTGNKRLKGFDGSWQEVALDNIAERITRRNEELDDTVVTISAQRGFVLQEEFFNKRVASELLSNYYLIHKGEFAYNKSYSNGYPMGAFKRLDNYPKAVVTTLYICFALKKNINSDFMIQFFEAGLMIPGLMKIAQEGGRAHGLLNISLSDFFSLKLTIPKIEEQNAIAKLLEEADQELKLTQTKMMSLQEQKKGLMQKLLTGEIRVNVK